MSGSLDEHDAVYGLVAQKVRISADKLTYTFFLRPEARFHDGSKLTAHDAAFSFDILKKEGSPRISELLRDMESVTALRDDILVVKFAEGRAARSAGLCRRASRSSPRPIMRRINSTRRRWSRRSARAPISSGAFEPGRAISYRARADYWGKDLPVNVGQDNFDVIRYEYFGDRNVAFEAFKSGAFTVHEEFTVLASGRRAMIFPRCATAA